MARALVCEPELVQMDEPLGALDKQLREYMRYEIRHTHDHLCAAVVDVTLDQSKALIMSDRITVFDDGRIQQLAPPTELYERPENAFVALFIGEKNQLIGKVDAVGGSIVSVSFEDRQSRNVLSVSNGPVGGPTLLSIRPERVQTGAPASENSVSAQVLELVYLGDHIRCRMRVHGNEEFIVNVPNSAGHTHLQVG